MRVGLGHERGLFHSDLPDFLRLGRLVRPAGRLEKSLSFNTFGGVVCAEISGHRMITTLI